MSPQGKSIAAVMRACGAVLIMLFLCAAGRVFAQCASGGGDCCEPSDCCTNSCNQNDATCDLSSQGGPCVTDDDCSGSLYCNCNYACEPLGNAGDPCPCGDGDCSGSLSCVNGSCMDCTNECNNSSCPGYDVCMCVGACADSSCSGYDVCTCVGTCADSSCPGYDPCTCE